MTRLERLVTVTRRLTASRRLQAAFIACAVLAAGLAVLLDRDAFLAAVGQLGLGSVALALGCTVVNVLAAAQAWRCVLADLGTRLPVRAAFRIFLVGSLGKYIPGSMWFLLAQMELAARDGIPRPRTGAASLVTVVLTVATALMASLAIILFAAGSLPSWLTWVPLLLPLVVMALYPPLLNRALNGLLRRLGRSPLEYEVSAVGTLRAVSWSLLSWLAIGAQVSVLAVTVGAPLEGRTLALCLGGYALAWAIGFATVIAPAGAGTREAVILLVLAAVVLPSGGALVVALMSRLLLTLADLGLAAAFGVRHTRTTGTPTSTAASPGTAT